MSPEDGARYEAMSVAELEVAWVVLMSQGRRLMNEIVAVGVAGTTGVRPADARQLIGRYRDIEARWDYVDDLLLAHEARDPEHGWQPVGGTS